jgi:[ribosomal protein S5]-alanine N-acetyltransferase
MELHTQRLILREFRADDVDALRECESSPAVQRYERPISGDAATHAHLQQSIAWAQESPRTHYRMALTIRPDDRMRGRLALWVNNSDIAEWEIGWTVHERFWGQGYASEAALRMLAFAFTDLKAHRVVAFCNAGNIASRRVMEKVGMRQEGLLRATRWLYDNWHDEYVYAILERDWRR